MDKKNRIYLYIAIFIPILMIIVTACNIIFFKTNLHPLYNFIYMINNDGHTYACTQQVKEYISSSDTANQIKFTATNLSASCNATKLYEYDFANGKSNEITLLQIKQLKITPSSKPLSPDGFLINSYCNSSDISGWGLYKLSNYSVCLKKDNLQQRLNINDRNASSNKLNYFTFIGWIIPSNVSTP